ncbi:hypothetical protein D3C72_1405480 [compost metagenome]
MAQGALGDLHFLDVEQVEHRAQHAQAAADHGLAVFAHAVDAQLVDAAGLEQAVEQPVEALARDEASLAAGGSEHVAHRADGAGGAVGHVPLVAGVAGERVVQHGLGRDFGGAKGGGGELAFAEMLHRPGDAAHAVRLHALGLERVADDHFGGAPADVDDEAALLVGRVGVRQVVRHALVDQAGFFPARDHVDAEAQDGARAQQELFAVARFAQGLGGHGAHLRAFEAGQPLAEAGEGVPAALHGFGREVAGAVQAVALAHGFLEVLGAVDLSVVDLADFQPEAVRAEIDRCEAGAVLHFLVKRAVL